MESDYLVVAGSNHCKWTDDIELAIAACIIEGGTILTYHMDLGTWSWFYLSEWQWIDGTWRDNMKRVDRFRLN